MFRISIGEQLNKNELIEEILKYSLKANVEIFIDTEAALKVHSVDFDYYVGAIKVELEEH